MQNDSSVVIKQSDTSITIAVCMNVIFVPLVLMAFVGSLLQPQDPQISFADDALLLLMGVALCVLCLAALNASIRSLTFQGNRIIDSRNFLFKHVVTLQTTDIVRVQGSITFRYRRGVFPYRLGKSSEWRSTYDKTMYYFALEASDGRRIVIKPWYYDQKADWSVLRQIFQRSGMVLDDATRQAVMQWLPEYANTLLASHPQQPAQQ